MPKKIIIIFDQHQESAIKELLKKQADVQVFALNNLIGDFLTSQSIKNQYLDDFISEPEQKEIQKKAAAETIKKYNQILFALRLNKKLLSFFDAVKFKLWKKSYRLYFYFFYFSLFLEKTKPDKVYFFSYIRNPFFFYLKNALLIKKINFEIIRLGFWTVLKTKISHFPAFWDNWLSFQPIKTHGSAYHHDQFQKLTNHNEKIIAKNKTSGNIVLISPFFYRSDVNENLPLIKKIESGGRKPILILNRRLPRRIFSLLKKENINYLFIALSDQIEKPDAQDLKRFIFLFSQNLLPTQYFAPEIKNWQLKNFRLSKLYRLFHEYSVFSQSVCVELKPTIILSINNFSLFSRIDLMSAKTNQIKSIFISTALEETAHCQLTDNRRFQPPIYSAVLPDLILTAGQNTALGFSRHRPLVSNERREETIGSLDLSELSLRKESLMSRKEKIKAEIFKKWKLPNNAKLIIFTGQPLAHNFECLRILTRAFFQLRQNRESWRNYYLLLRPHPRQRKIFYQLSSWPRHSHILIEKDFKIEEVLICSEFLITLESFSAAEAIILDKKILILNFYRQINQPDFFNLTSIKKINKPNNLAQTLAQLASQPEEIKHEFDYFFKLNQNLTNQAFNSIKNL